ncbi:kinase-like domain-containing protein [Rhizophagus clarus]|uniref:Kinase-like domain-containing protein n=1 Tax=Rhizophagus clarus TaxID=94130 RepID=A0A8H3QIY8_9GLOM|nr:kinase-like domain-containing protein [Rhizophagus clarus]
MDYMLIMEYANKGNLRGCLSEITNNWEQKLYILYIIIGGLDKLHKENLIHYDFHDEENICGVIPFMAPEVLRDLMKKCWDNDPLKRPTASEVLDIINKWVILPNEMKIKNIDKKLKNNIMEFINAPIGHNNFITETHPQAYYTSRLLDFTSEELNVILDGSLESKFLELRQRNKDAEQKLFKLEKIAETYYQSSQNGNQVELVDLQQKNSQFEQDNQNLKLNLAEKIKEFAEKEITLQTKITSLQKEIYEKQALTSNLTKQLEQSKLASQQIQIQINQLKQEKSDLQEKLSQTEAKIKELISQRESLIKQKEQLEIELNQSRDNCDQLKQEKYDLHNIMGGILQDQKFTAKLKIKCAKLVKEIAQLEQKLNNEEQIKVQLIQAIQIKEDKINELEQILINLDNKNKSINELIGGESTQKIHKEKEEMFGLQRELSKTSTSCNDSRKEQVLDMDNFDKVIKELKHRFNHLEISLTTNSEKGNRTHLDFSMIVEEINLLRKNLDVLELRLNQEFKI